MRVTKDKIIENRKSCVLMVKVDHSKNTEEPSLLFCTKIELINNHLMFSIYSHLVFKVWLDRENYLDISEALKNSNLEILK